MLGRWMLIGMEGPGDCLICRQMIRGWDAHGASSRGGDVDRWGIGSQDCIGCKGQPHPLPRVVRKGLRVNARPPGHTSGGAGPREGGSSPVLGGSQVWPRLPCGPSLCLLPGVVFCLIAQQLSSAVLEPSFLPQDVCFVLFFFDVNYF